MADEIPTPPGYSDISTPPSTLNTSQLQIKTPPGYSDIDQRGVSGPPQAPFSGTSQPPKPLPDSFLQGLPKFLSDSLPMVGSGLGGPGGTMVGGALQQLLRIADPNSFGKAPTSPWDVVKETGENLIGQDVVPGALAGLASKAGVAKVLGSAPAKWTPQVKEAANLDKAGELANMGDSYALPGGPNLLQQREASSVKGLFSKGYSPSAKSIDPDKILKELDANPDSYSNIQPETKKNVVDFLQSVPKTPDSNSPFKYINHRLLWEAGAGLAAGHLFGHEVVGGAALVLGDKALSALMNNPGIAKMVVSATKGELSPGAMNIAQRLILGSLHGTDAILTAPGKEDEKVTVGEGGQIQYPQKP